MYSVHFEPFFVSRRLRVRDIDGRLVDEFAIDRKTNGLNRKHEPTGISQGRLSRLMITLKALLNWGATRGYCHKPEGSWFGDTRSKKRSVQPLSIAQVEKLLAEIPASPTNYRAFTAMLVYSGARMGEARVFDWSDFSPDFTEVWIRRSVEGQGTKDYTKTGDDRRMPIVPRLQVILREHWDETGKPSTGLVFPQASGKRIDDSNFRTRGYKPSLARAELDETMRLHDLRHVCASLLGAANVPLRDAMDVLGWKQLATAQRYMHSTLNNEQLSARFGSMWDAEMTKESESEDATDESG